MVDPTTGIDLEKAGIADIVNRQNVGASQRARNELIRQQTQSGQSTDLSSLYSTKQSSQNNSGIMPFETWQQQYKNPDYWKYDELPKTNNMFGNVGDQWSSYREGIPKYTKGLEDYIKYAAPDLVSDADWKKNTSNAFVSHSANGISDYLYGSPNLEINIQNPLYKNPNTPKEVLAALYPSTSAFLKDDPFIQQLNSKYQYIAPASQSQLRSAEAEGGSGFDFRTNPYGSWDLGHDNLYLTPKFKHGQGLDMHPEGSIYDRYLNSKYYNPYNEDGTFNPEGWEVRSNKSQAMGGVIGTLGILGAAAGPSMFGPGGGTAGTLGSENMFFGGTSAIAPTATQSAGMFGNTAWDLGNKYVNKAAEGALKGFLFSGGNPTAALQGGLTGPVGGYISESLNPYVGDIASKSLGGAASGTLASLFTKNNPIAGSLYGGMSGGLNAYLNSVNANSDTFNKMASNTLSGLVRKKLFRNK